jgi:ATP/maltotriose-dependent transcriptional regulator MalT
VWVDRLSGGLANALTGRQDGAQTLASLERANAFIVAVDPDRLWYRYHPLFAELLRFELRRRAPEELVRLHQRAARWHAEQGAPVDAVQHALDAGDWGYGVELLVRYGLGLALRGDTMAIRQLAQRLPATWMKATTRATSTSSGRGRSPRDGPNQSRHHGSAVWARPGTRSPRPGRAVAVRSVVATGAW